ncbi:DUF6308 family protein [Corynebacterium pacaense]|uniref:DUF6308 family protein n=1 Tax=Corynebacterium pacaense TaxID=1816684 RepID=UPI0009BA962F|nr:DUF6308 family protein [Corynebacterium pacaense]
MSGHTLPQALSTDDVDTAASYLREYYGERFRLPDAVPPRYSGAYFDGFDPSGQLSSSPNIITADDLLSLSLLSTPINGSSAVQLLFDHRSTIQNYLETIPTDRTLADYSEPLSSENFAAWRLENFLTSTIPGVGWTRASKLIARKRPLLYPIYDSVVSQVLGTVKGGHLNFIRESMNRPEISNRIDVLRQETQLSDIVPDLRIFDVVAWMEGRARKLPSENLEAVSDE